MKCHFRSSALLVLLVSAAMPAWSAYSCTFVPNPNPLKITHSYFATVTGSGTITMSCLRNPATDARRPWFWIGMDQTNTGTTAQQEDGAATVNYEINHGSTTQGTWTSTGGVAANSTTDGAVRERQDFGGGNSPDLTRVFTFYYRVPAFQFDPAGVYSGTVNITLREANAAGPVITTYAWPVRISIPDSCIFSTPPSAVAINYQAFQPGPATGTSNFELTCTNGTPYTLRLSLRRSAYGEAGFNSSPTTEIRWPHGCCPSSSTRSHSTATSAQVRSGSRCRAWCSAPTRSRHSRYG